MTGSALPAPPDIAALLARDFGTVSEMVAAQARVRPEKAALVDDDRTLTFRELDARLDRVAAALQREGLRAGEAVAICAANSVDAAVAFLGVLRAGGAAAPLAASSTGEALAGMIADCGARTLFLDAAAAEVLSGAAQAPDVRRVALDGSAVGVALETWLAPPGARPSPAPVAPQDAFNIIYSSGTTGVPKGIVQPHAMRWAQVRRGAYDAESVTLVSTPLCSNTTLVSFLPTVANGGTTVLMPRFEAGRFLALAEAFRVTHAMLVPVQYDRLLARPDFDRFDLTSFRTKFCTSAPFAAGLKVEVLRRWPGGLVEFYGMTEGGGSCMLLAHDHPDKLHTVGRPMPGHDVRLIDEGGREVGPGETGEVVGRSPAMMVGYHRRAAATADAEWTSPEGLRFIRTGDLGAFDADGFLVLKGRRKDLIISGGFNIYPADLESVIAGHPAVAESAVVGAPSARWGESPVAFVALRAGADVSPEALRLWANERLGRTQRLADVRIVPGLPRSAIGKVLKRELRAGYDGEVP